MKSQHYNSTFAVCIFSMVVVLPKFVAQVLTGRMIVE